MSSEWLRVRVPSRTKLTGSEEGEERSMFGGQCLCFPRLSVGGLTASRDGSGSLAVRLKRNLSGTERRSILLRQFATVD